MNAQQDKLMNDTELADRLVALGVGSKHFGLYSSIHVNSTIGTMVEPSLFVRGWRVAGECLQKWPTTINTEHLDMTLDQMLRDPRAIIEAYVEALEPVLGRRTHE